MLSCAAMAPIAQHRGGDAQLASDLDQRPTAARQQGNRLPLELIRKMTPFLAHSTPFRSRRSLAKVSTNAGEAQFEGALNGQRFRAYVEQMLAPTLAPGDIVLLDTLRSHKVAGIAEAVAAREAQLIYLPLYSPDLDPIEQAFAK